MIVVFDGSYLFEPSDEELAKKLTKGNVSRATFPQRTLRRDEIGAHLPDVGLPMTSLVALPSTPRSRLMAIPRIA
jgi:hypothetical protein